VGGQTATSFRCTHGPPSTPASDSRPLAVPTGFLDGEDDRDGDLRQGFGSGVGIAASHPLTPDTCVFYPAALAAHFHLETPMTIDTAADGILSVDQILATEALQGESSLSESSLNLTAPIRSADVSQAGFLAYLPAAFVAMRGSPANAFETATAATIWDAYEATTRPRRYPSIK